MPRKHEEILENAVRKFFDLNNRWPTSVDELDPYGLREFGSFSIAGFNSVSGEEIILRYVCETGKAVVRVSNVDAQNS